MKVKSEPRITLIYVMGCDWVLVGGGIAVVGGLACGPAPPRALTLTLSRRAGEGECL